jgi:uncharacterized membrane protein (UPF0127 family)
LAPNRHGSFTYRLVVQIVRALLVAITVLATGATATASGSKTAALRLDGETIRPELALTSAQRSVGLMHRTSAPVDGMLFVFPGATNGGFWMKNTLVPLKIVFFDVAGRRVRTMRMTPCREDDCPIYTPGRSYRFALELPAKDPRPSKVLGPRAQLRELVARAS